MSIKQANLYARIARPWIYEKPLFHIIMKRMEWVRANRPVVDMNKELREMFGLIEDGVRYRFVKFLRAYIQVLSAVRVERGLAPVGEAAKSLPLHLELGAFRRVPLILMGLGITRFTALLLARRVRFDPELDWDGVRQILLQLRLGPLNLPAVSQQEIVEWRG
jgi:hypothetical protein